LFANANADPLFQALEHFVIENIYFDKMLRRCEILLYNACEIGVGGSRTQALCFARR
jgi:hypothetical protein